MAKERRTVTLEREVDDYLAQDHVNASGLVNDLVKRHMNGDDANGAIREFRMNQLLEEANEYEMRAKRKREEVNRLQEVAKEKEATRDEEVQKVVEKLSGVERDPENPAIKRNADKLGITAQELLDKLPDDDDGSTGLNSL